MPSVRVITPKRNGIRRRKGCSNASTPRTRTRGAGIAIAMEPILRCPGRKGHRKGWQVCPSSRLLQPAGQIRRDEGVVAEVGMLLQHPVDLRRLTRAEALVRVEAPGAGEQALPAQHL